MSAIGLFVWALKYRMGKQRAMKWAVSGAVLGFAPYGAFAWVTRDDWNIANKLLGVLIMLVVEAGLVAVSVGIVK